MITINDYKNQNVCQTITAQYWKTSFANLTRGGQRFSKPGVIECEQDGNITQTELEKIIERSKTVRESLQ